MYLISFLIRKMNCSVNIQGPENELKLLSKLIQVSDDRIPSQVYLTPQQKSVKNESKFRKHLAKGKKKKKAIHELIANTF